jgi:hypothetical protein
MADFQNRMLATDYKAKYCVEGSFAVTESQKTKYDAMKADYATGLAEHKLSKFFSSEITFDELAMDIAMKYVAVYLITFVIAILGYLCYFCYCCCSCCTDKLCKCCCCCCDRDYKKKPIQNKEIRMLNIIVILLAVILIGIFSAGLSSATEIGKNIKSVCCAMVSMPYNLANGVTYGNITWVGL